jgi:hypothetical protein
MAQHHLVDTGPELIATVVVCQVNATATTATVLRGTASDVETIATVAADAADSDADALEPRGAIASVVEITRRAMRAAEISGADVTTTVLQAPDTDLPAIAAALRALGLAPRSASDTDTVRGALISTAAAVTGLAPGRRGPVGWRRHPVVTVLPLLAAAGLVAVLPHTGVSWSGPQPPRSPYLFTYWPAWGLVVLLAHVGVLAGVLAVADRRGSGPGTEIRRRRQLVRGLHGTAIATVATAAGTAAVASSAYHQVPLWYVLGWSLGPAALLAAGTAVIVLIVPRGHATALRWQIWLRLPTASLVLAVVGLLALELNLLAHRTAASYLDSSRSMGIGQIGTLAVALAVLPLVLHRIDHQLLAAPLVVGPVLWTHSYTTTNTVLGMYLAAGVAWWVTRIRPAGAYNNPHHPATRLVATLEAESSFAGPNLLPGG